MNVVIAEVLFFHATALKFRSEPVVRPGDGAREVV